MADPTALTTDALQREVAQLTALLDVRLEAVDLAHTTAIKTLTDIIELQEKLREEKLVAIEREMVLVERQRIEQKADTKLAVDAALQAQKEAVREQTAASALSIAKSENATNEQLKQLNVTFATAIAGVDRQLNDLKERIGKVENVEAAHFGKAEGSGNTMLWIILSASVIISIIAIMLDLLVPH